MAAKAPPQRAAVPSVDTGILKGATPLSPTAGNTRMRVSILLNVRHLAALKQRVASGFYRPGRFLTEPQFAARYGQRPELVRQFAAYLRSQGLKVQVYRDRLNIGASGPASAIESIFHVMLHNYRVPGQAAHNGRAARPAHVVHGTTQAPTLPGPFARATLAVLGLTSYHGAFASNARPARAQPHVHHAASGPPPGQLIPADFLRFYHGKQLQRAGHGGAGQTIGMVTLATLPRARCLLVLAPAWHHGVAEPADHAQHRRRRRADQLRRRFRRDGARRRAVGRDRAAGEDHRLPGPELRPRLQRRLVRGG